MYNIVTSLNKKYWNLGSKLNVTSWDNNFSQNVKIHVFSEDKIESNLSNRVVWYNLYEQSPELLGFIQKYKNNPNFNGTLNVNENKKFKWNAIKFAHKTFALFSIFESLLNEKIIWLDSDVLAYEKIDEDFLNTVCPDDKIISYLGRPSVYSECGWVYYNLAHPLGVDFLKQFQNIYQTNAIELLKETHDSFIFDVVRLRYNQDLFLNLNANAITNKPPFPASVLGRKFIHNKGENKLEKQQKNINKYKLHV